MSTNIRFVFFGTPELAVTVLDELEAAKLVPALVVTRPDAPKGRGKVLTPPPVKVWAEKKGVEVLQPERIDEAFTTGLRERGPWDVFVVAAYGKILPKALLDVPARGVLNVHPSLLPRWRGASPIQAQILHETDWRNVGISIMLLDEKMDHGPILTQVSNISHLESHWPIKASELTRLLGHCGGQSLAHALPKWIEGTLSAKEQDHASATYCQPITKENGFISLADPDELNFRKIYAYDMWPGAYTYFERNGRRIRVVITDAHLGEDGSLVIDRVIPEGKREMPYQDFLRSGARPVA